ncbi:MAG TPA: hypothetical protein PLY72_05680, partial [Candidatus Obscuribacter sp.]|nr:hypothetical protein [Candidatus Obscuribacter sp.]
SYRQTKPAPVQGLLLEVFCSNRPPDERLSFGMDLPPQFACLSQRQVFVPVTISRSFNRSARRVEQGATYDTITLA